MEDLSLHILDVAENGIRAGADLIKIDVEENLEEDRLLITIQDNGHGMTPEFLAEALDPFVTTRTTRSVGLGLSLFQQTAREADGDLEVQSEPKKGTKVTAVMSHGHIDRKPMGNMVETVVTLIQGNPDVDFVYSHRKQGREYLLDTREIRSLLEEIPINSLGVVNFIRENLAEGLEEIDAE